MCIRDRYNGRNAVVVCVNACVVYVESTWAARQPTAGFMTHVVCRLTAKNRDQLQNPTLGNRVWAARFTFTFTDKPSYLCVC